MNPLGRFLLAIALLAPGLVAAPAQASPPSPQKALTAVLSRGMKQAGSQSGAYVVDLSTGRTLFALRASTRRLPASVQKLYTTSTALLRFGPGARLQTSVYGVGTLQGHTWAGTLYLRGGGDPTFGSAAFDHVAYGGGATVQQLVANLVRETGIDAVRGRIIGDESYFDSRRGTPATGWKANFYVEGQLSALVYDRGFTSTAENAFQPRPALFATRAFVAALRADHVKVPRTTPVYTGRTPATATRLASVSSPRMATLIRWTLTPSDNFFAETLLKDIGASFGGAGTTAAGVAVVRGQMRASFGLEPVFDDGSGLSYYDHTSPRQVVTLLEQMSRNKPFVDALAIAGRTGTLQDEMRGTVAQGRCRAKTGTLMAVSNMAGYCQAADGHTLAFAFLMNGVDPLAAHPIQDRMAEALAAYDG